jgi:twitching motility protein PilT
MVRIDGELYPLKLPPLKPPDIQRLCYSVLTDAQRKRFEEKNELDFSFQWKGVSRFRANYFRQRGAMAAAIRMIPTKIMGFDELGLPSILNMLIEKPRGLILVTGPTGSGKSTALASMIDVINNNRRGHIITVEDPIEYLHQHKNSIVNQREIGMDTPSFSDSLRYIMRQDPDVIMIGEIRDLETIEATLRLSETGHLVFATLHTNNTAQTINRIVDFFPPAHQDRVRTQLSFVIEGILSLQLCPRADGRGRVLSVEVMIPNAAIRNLIRENKVHQIYSQMQVGQTKFGMQTMNQALFRLWSRKLITKEEALSRSTDVDEILQMFANEEKLVV